MSSERGDGRAKLNMEHGFMQSIIKNQVDRDEYDKEQKLLKVQNKISGPSRRERPRRADQQVYVPPHLRGKAATTDQETEPQTSSTSTAKGKFQVLGSVVFLWFVVIHIMSLNILWRETWKLIPLIVLVYKHPASFVLPK